MTPFLPDWMFAAFAIGGWELMNLVETKFHWRWGREVGYSIVCVCIIIVCIRYLSRFIQRKRHPEVEDPEAWKRY